MADQYRNERKFLIPLSRHEAEATIRHHPALFRTLHQVRQVNNIYLDTVGNRYYLDNVDGLSHRKKVRIRWYGSLFGTVRNPRLETKLKSGVVGRKVSYPLCGFDLEKGFSAETFRDIVDTSELPVPLRADLRSLQLRLLNCYTRGYFQSADERFRLTLDWGLTYYQLKQRNNRFLHRFRDFSHCVVELKYAPDANSAAPTITSQFPFRMTRSSKYVMGLNYLQGLHY